MAGFQRRKAFYIEAGNQMSDCIAIIQVKGGKFTRVLPSAAHTWRCQDGYWDFGTNTKKRGYPS